jgi:CzcA family heavy metal efflux pump
MDVRDARQVVSERLSLVAPSLPGGVDPPSLAPTTSIMGEILVLGLTSQRADDVELRALAETAVRRRLLSTSGVAQVTILGGRKKQYQVLLSPERLFAHAVSVEDVALALQSGNENAAAGLMDEGGSQYLVVGLGRVREPREVEDIVVRAGDGAPVRVGDLGRVVIGGAPKLGDGSVRGEPAVIIAVQKQPHANTLTLTDRIDDLLDDIEARLPPGVRLERDLFRQREFIDVAVRNVFHALRDGSILVVLIMALFLASVRATVITLTAIPLSLCAAVVVLLLWGATINTMTLGGMAIAIGALVDDAVIDVENVTRRLRENAALPADKRRTVFRVVLDASVEIRVSIAFATFIVILVFLPVFFLSGIEGRLLRPLGVSYVVALVASLVVAVTLTPVLCFYLIPSSRGVATAREPRFTRMLRLRYAALLGPVLDRPWRVIAPAALLFAAALAVAQLWGRSFLPHFNEGNLTVTAMTLPGTALAESSLLGRRVEGVFLDQEEVVSTSRRTGRSEGDEHVMGAEGSELDIVLRMKDRSQEELLAALREKLGAVPGVNIAIGQPISHRIDHMLSGTEAGLAIKLFGPDLYELRDLAARVSEAVSEVEGAVDVQADQQADVPQLRVRYDREALARHGVRVEDVSHTLEAAYAGHLVSTVIEREQSFDLVVRLDDGEGWSTDRVHDLPISAAGGRKVPLGALATITRDLGPNRITRERAQRKIVVQANVAGRDLASVVADVRERVNPLVRALPGYEVEYGGQFESAESAGRLLFLLGVGVVIGIAGLLHLAFGSVRDALLVMANLPLALIGAVGGVYWSGGVLSIASLIGFITVFGIAARNGILLVSHFRYLQEHEGVRSLREAVERGAAERLAPVLMTALGTALALAPLALSGGRPGNEIQAPMAQVILCGLLSSTVLNLIVVPALYLTFGKPTAAHQGMDA